MAHTTYTHFVVVDDNPDDRLVMETLLKEDLGVSTHDLPPDTWGRDLLPALQDCLQSRLDVVLLDLQLPTLHGMQLIRLMRQSPGFREVRIIAVTAHNSPENVDLARRSGFDGFIGKPLQIQRFSQQMRRILSGEAVWEPN